MIDKDIKTIADHFGYSNQVTKLLEEIGELLQSVAKELNNETYENAMHVIEEIADVEILLEQYKYLNAGYDLVGKIKKQKIQRTLERIKSGYYEK